jgi:hypothetical protein
MVLLRFRADCGDDLAIDVLLVVLLLIMSAGAMARSLCEQSSWKRFIRAVQGQESRPRPALPRCRISGSVAITNRYAPSVISMS